MKKPLFSFALSFVALAMILLASCNKEDNPGGTIPPPVLPPSGGGDTYFFIHNQTEMTLADVRWGNELFGDFGNTETRGQRVSASSGVIEFRIVEKDVVAVTDDIVGVEQGPSSERPYTLTGRTYVKEKGTDFTAVPLSQLQKSRPPKAGKVDTSVVTSTSFKVNSSVEDIGHPEYTERGFCYSKDKADLTVSLNCSPVAGGDFMTTIKDLTDGVTYYVVAYIGNDGKHPRQYSDTIAVTTVSGAPRVGGLAVVDTGYDSVRVRANVLFAGLPSYADGGEVGFCLSEDSLKLDESTYKADGVESQFSRVISGLKDNKKHYLKAYIDNREHRRQYSNTVTFTTKNGAPVISVAPTLLGVGYDTARVEARIAFAGVPSYLSAAGGERGFCVWTDTVNLKDHPHTVEGSSSPYAATFTGLRDETLYYARAYVDNGKHDRVYGPLLTFTTLSGKAGVSISPAANVTTESALLRATVLKTVNSDYTEKGFCYSPTSRLPEKGSATAVCVEVAGMEAAFEREIKQLQIAKTYYARAYIENGYGPTVYSDVVTFETNVFVDKSDNKRYRVKDIGGGVIWFMEDMSYQTWTSAKTACPAGWRLPTGNDWQVLADRWDANKVDFTGDEDGYSPAFWWIDQKKNDNEAYYAFIEEEYDYYYREYDYYLDIGFQRITAGAAVRCVKE